MSIAAIDSVKCFDKAKVFDAMDGEIRKILLKEKGENRIFKSLPSCYDLFTLDELGMNYSHTKLNHLEKIFSIKKYKKQKKDKVQICFLGMKFRI